MRGYVYLLRAIDLGWIKIGWSRNPVVRAAEISKMGVDIEFLGAIDAVRSDEYAMHRRFRHLRLALEWFRPEGELLEFLSTLPPCTMPLIPASRKSDYVKRMVLGRLHPEAG